jgi:hypothetical protein
MLRIGPFVLLLILLMAITSALAQALDARIDGTVCDANGAAVSGVNVTAKNLGTGESKTASTNSAGTFRFPIIGPGGYVMSAEAKGFKRAERRGINLSAGESVMITILIEVGSPNEVVVVSADAAIADVSRSAVGRQLNQRDINDLPLLARNPYNLVLLQPGVNGREKSDPSVIDLSVAGLRRRAAYQIDGSNDNDYNSSGFRLTMPSEIFVKEMQLLSTGYPAEFGGTAGAIVNTITRSGTNELNGTITAIYRPSILTAKPFGFQPGTGSNIAAYGGTAALGGPIIRDRWHYFAGYEWTRRNYIVPIDVTPQDQKALIAAGLSPTIFLNKQSTSDTLPYFSVRSDARLSRSTRISFRYSNFIAALRHAVTGGLLTTDRSFGFSGYSYSLATQAVTSFTPTFFSEFRFQVGRHITRTIGDELTGRGPTVTVVGSAAFGPDPNVGSVTPNEGTFQFQETITRVVGDHSFKFGGGLNFIRDRPTAQLGSQYTFADVGKYLQALTGLDRRSYSKYQETVGNSQIGDDGIYFNFFFQDDWTASRKLRLSLGLRYELFQPPMADALAPLDISRRFNVDLNNFAPRLGLTYLLHDGKYRALIRFGSGVYYDPPLIGMYRRALLNNGNPRYVTFTLSNGDLLSPDFPDRVGTAPPPRDIDAVAPDFKTMYAIRSSFQVEQQISEDASVTLGYIVSAARHIPVYRNINCLPTGEYLADGRPIYGIILPTDNAGNFRITACTQRIYPQFNIIKLAESVGNQNYHGVFIQFMKRLSGGVQLNANYTLSRSRDDAPEENGPASLTLSDPSNRESDSGRSRGDVTHVFNMSMVARPSVRIENRFWNSVVNDNQLSMIVLADSGETFNITTGDLNLDGITGATGPDRPVGMRRNAGRLPAFLNVDARYSRFLTFSEKRSLEFYVEATNVFNHKQVDQYNSTSLASNNLFTSPVNPLTGELRSPLPDRSAMSPTWRDSRQVQLGLRIHF